MLLACLAAGAVCLLCLRRLRRAYHARLRQLAERERVATSLHDTLLQSMQGMILRFQSVGHRMAADSAERAALEQILDQADEVLAEGRHQILALRVPLADGDRLSQALAAAGQALQETFDVPFRMLISGDPAPVNGDRAEQMYAIMREALVNAFQHARASRIELSLDYGCAFLTLRVRDNGRGMTQLPAGYAALRERAAAMAASLDVLSVPRQGTEVILKVPGEVCYQTPRAPRRRRGLAAWLRRG
ncbi:hypothetical protein GTP44_10585 [Duganella sp. FT50W]|uniref:Histidine kinase/HSP90-like ATPase domain-containing protein n=1 Tax=Duganella lactea TaxID=2692173 RepID=A0A6L8MH65_9BURK|nr:histidine kinase [Duganella lactea]MYM82397.1 hypothetical protein [Duganella lactea]